MYKETALSRARAALQHNPLLLLMCALSVLVHKTAVTTAAPIAGSFPYRCVKYQTDSALTAQLVAFASCLYVLFHLVMGFASVTWSHLRQHRRPVAARTGATIRQEHRRQRRFACRSVTERLIRIAASVRRVRVPALPCSTTRCCC